MKYPSMIELANALALKGNTTDANILRELIEAHTAQAADIERLQALSVSNILLAVVPGDGNGQEVYAQNVAQVENLLAEQIERIEGLENICDTLNRNNAALSQMLADANLHSLNGTGALTAQLDQTTDMLMLESMKAMDTLRAALVEDRPDHMAHLCALAHSAVSLMILPPFARDAHKLRADGTLEPQTKDTP